MKAYYLTILPALALGLMSVSCSGNADPDGDDILDGNVTPPFTLSVNKETIESDGKDEAVFTLTDASGNKITESSQLKYVSLEVIETGDIYNRTNKFTSIKNGTFTIKAKYKSHESENSIKITSSNRAKYEKYLRKVVVHEMTDVQCTACPSMVTALHSVPDIWKSQMVVLAVHGGFSQADPWNLGNMGVDINMAFYGQNAFPSAVFNLDRALKNDERYGKTIGGIISEQLRNNPATCGFKLSSEFTADGHIKIDAAITSSTGGNYCICYGVVADGLEHKGGVSVKDDGIYDDVLIATTSNYRTYSKKEEIVLAKDEEKTGLTNTFDRDFRTISGGFKKENARVFVYALREVNGKPIIDNIAMAPLGETLDYQYNE